MTPPKQTKKEFTSDQEVRWCPGCGDYVILAAVQSFLPELGLRRENIVFVSGIGCSSRFPYYLDTYGMHSIHGRAPAIATGLATSRSDLSVWVVTGDGDALSIGGNHLIHAMRRNVNLTILLFNNQIYGLTKGQYSPTSRTGLGDQVQPARVGRRPVQPGLARPGRRGHLRRPRDGVRPRRAQGRAQGGRQHRGTALVEIYQNCPIFNDGAFEVLKDRSSRTPASSGCAPARPSPWGAEGDRKVLVRKGSGVMKFVDEAEAETGEKGAVVVHDPALDDPSQAFQLSRLDSPEMTHVPMGVFRQVQRPAYDDLVRAQVEGAVDAAGGPAGDDDLAELLRGRDTWTVG